MTSPLAPRRARPACQGRGLKVDFGSVVEISSFAPDPLLAGIGSDPWGGTSQIFVPVPDAPSSPGNRYLYRLAVGTVGSDEQLEIVGFRQAVQIGVLLPPERPEDEPTNVVIEQTTPGWRGFNDGNISWHITWWPSNPRQRQPTPRTPGAPLFTQFDYWGVQPGLLARSWGPYIAPGKGVPPGQPVGQLGNFWELRAPLYSQGTVASEGYRVVGPANVGFFCSVKQTNPDREGRASPPPELGLYLPPETRFVADYPAAVYKGVAGSLLVRRRPA